MNILDSISTISSGLVAHAQPLGNESEVTLHGAARALERVIPELRRNKHLAKVSSSYSQYLPKSLFLIFNEGEKYSPVH